jgi:sensor histidine kinase YesM
LKSAREKISCAFFISSSPSKATFALRLDQPPGVLAYKKARCFNLKRVFAPQLFEKFRNFRHSQIRKRKIELSALHADFNRVFLASRLLN